MVRFIFPVDGDVLNSNDGIEREGRLFVQARVIALSDGVVVSGIPATYDGTLHEFRAEVPLDGWRNTITATTTDGETMEITVIRLKDAVGYYQFFIDDNIWFLRDIAQNASRYQSIYNNPYLLFFKSMHDKYGALIHMHIYYETDGFNLSQMPDKFKNEWVQAATWLRLTFHARADKPDFPHRNANYEDTLKEFDLVTNEIRRFAGNELLSPSTVPHWNEMSKDAERAFRIRGIRIIPGVGNSRQYLEKGLTKRIKARDFWYDADMDVFTCWSDICLNRTPTERIVEVLEAAKANPQTGGFIYMMIHEQYYYTDYVAHLTDFCERVERGIKWAVENGYRTKWIEDVVLEPNIYTYPD